MLDKRWKIVRIGLLLYGGSLLVSMLVTLALLVLSALDMRGAVALVMPAMCLSLLLSLLGTVGVGMFATVPSESRAKVAAVIAAIMSVGQLGLTALQLAPLGELTALLSPLSTLAGLITFFAMLRALRAIGLYVREDKIYDRAASLSMGLAVLMVLAVGMVLFGIVSPLVATVGLLFVAFGALLIAIGYVFLVLKTASAIKAMTVQ